MLHRNTQTIQARERLRHATAVFAAAETGYWEQRSANGMVRILFVRQLVGITAAVFCFLAPKLLTILLPRVGK